MPCYEPLRAVLVSGPQGRRLDFSSRAVGKGITLPCGRCIGCRLERSRQWAVRIMHETKMHDASSFITLTYEKMPKGESLSVEDCQLFLKRLRARLAPKKIRFFLCGEYGEKLGRPHYHAIIFGEDFSFDRVKLSKKNGFYLYESAMLTETWGHGGVRIGDVSFDSAAYVANYATKKITGKGAEAHYAGKRPEFLLMSRRPGIARSWIQQYASDVYPSDSIIANSKECRPPRYYDNFLETIDPELRQKLREAREDAAAELEEMVIKSGQIVHVAPGNNARRLAVRKTVATAKAALKRRDLENA